MRLELREGSRRRSAHSICLHSWMQFRLSTGNLARRALHGTQLLQPRLSGRSPACCWCETAVRVAQVPGVPLEQRRRRHLLLDERRRQKCPQRGRVAHRGPWRCGAAPWWAPTPSCCGGWSSCRCRGSRGTPSLRAAGVGARQHAAPQGSEAAGGEVPAGCLVQPAGRCSTSKQHALGIGALHRHLPCCQPLPAQVLLTAGAHHSCSPPPENQENNNQS